MSDETLHWDDLELLRLLAETGTAAAAARVLGLDQTTVSRRLQRIERELSTPLFDRLDRRLVPTPALGAALAALTRMAETAEEARAAIRSAQARLTGSVAISAVDPLASWVLSPRVGRLAAAHPQLSLEIRVENRNVSLARREADIALRLGRPVDDLAVVRRLALIHSCLAGPARARRPEELPLATYEESLRHLPEARWLAARWPGLRPSFQTNVLRSLVEAAAGGMQTVLPAFVVAADPRLADLAPGEGPPPRELWLMVHAERRRDPVVAAVIDWIAVSLREALGGTAA